MSEMPPGSHKRAPGVTAMRFSFPFKRVRSCTN